MRIRVANGADADGIAGIHRRSIEELCRTHYDTEDLAEWVRALQQASYGALIVSRVVLVATEGDDVFGFAVLDASEGLIQAIYVSPDAVGRGAGRALLEAIESAARESGCERLRLNATLNAVGFYERADYASEGPASNRLPSGAELPCVAMSKTLIG